jgi:cysteine synthase A
MIYGTPQCLSLTYMPRVRPFHDILETVGGTPVVRLNRMIPEGSAEVYAKLESFNPMSSIKDRVAKAMIERAEREGRVRPGCTIVEPTSGNMGIGLAMVCAVRGYRLVLTMPDSMSMERRKMLAALGAEVVLTPRESGMCGAVERAAEIVSSTPDAYMPSQFSNEANPGIHRESTAQEIISCFERVDAFVAGVGTGGTITGVGRALKEVFPSVLVVAVEPVESAVLSGGPAGTHGIQGIGAGFVPEVLDRGVIDRVVTVSYEDAATTCRRLARMEGIFAGISSGAAAFAAIQIAEELGSGKSVVTILPDTGERYLSTDLFEGKPDDTA